MTISLGKIDHHTGPAGTGAGPATTGTDAFADMLAAALAGPVAAPVATPTAPEAPAPTAGAATVDAITPATVTTTTTTPAPPADVPPATDTAAAAPTATVASATVPAPAPPAGAPVAPSPGVPATPGAPAAATPVAAAASAEVDTSASDTATVEVPVVTDRGDVVPDGSPASATPATSGTAAPPAAAQTDPATVDVSPSRTGAPVPSSQPDAGHRPERLTVAEPAHRDAGGDERPVDGPAPAAHALGHGPAVAHAADGTRPDASSQAVAPTALASRIRDTVEQLQHAAPPRHVTLEVGDLRLSVSLRGETVHVVFHGEPPAATTGWSQEVSAALADRGMTLSTGTGEQHPGGRSQQHPDTPPAPRPTSARSATRRPRSGLHL